MKYIYRIFSLIAVGLIVWSCENDYVPPHDSVPNGGFLRFDEPLLPVIDFTAIETSAFTNVLVDPSGSVSSFEMFVSIVKPDSTFDTVSLQVITAFPHNLSISAQDVVDAYTAGLENSTLDLDGFDAGDQLNIFSVATREDGSEFTTADFTGDLNNPGMRQALDYTVFFSCPFSSADAVTNSYLITRDDFVTTLDITDPILVEEIDESNILFIDMFKHPEMYDIIVTVDPATGVATVDKQEAWECANFGCAFGTGSVEGTGFFFSCTGFLTLDLSHTVAAGGFGTFRLELQRQ